MNEQPPSDPWTRPDEPTGLPVEDVSPTLGAAEAATGPSRPAPRGITWAAWLIIVVMSAAMLLFHTLGKQQIQQQAAAGEDAIGLMIMELQSQHIVFAARFQDQQQQLLLYAQTEALNIGTVGQRQRFAILGGELMGPDEALSRLAELKVLITEEHARRAFELRPEDERIGTILETLYGADQDPVALTDDDRDFLASELGWFGELALNPVDSDDTDTRNAVMSAASGTFWVMIGGAVLACVAGLAGLLGLITIVVLAIARRLRGGLGPAGGHHGIYAETFAVWLLLFIPMLLGAGVLGGLVGGFGIELSLVAFFVSLVALGWPVVRGIPWSTVRRDIGLTAGRNPVLEPIFGVIGYLSALPLLAVGIAMTLMLVQIQQLFKAEGSPFGPSGGAAHPVIQELAGGWYSKLVVLLLASVAAPVVEEIMFRGVLYRHLRDVTGVVGPALSVVLAASISGFVFAIIHPQGWVAVPILMSLAYAFALAREWRGTLVPAMVMHAVSNGVVMSFLILALG